MKYFHDFLFSANRKTAFEFDKYNIPGVPDGMTIDTDGNLWVAVFDGGRVLHVDPRTGKLLSTIEVPAKQVRYIVIIITFIINRPTCPRGSCSCLCDRMFRFDPHKDRKKF